MGKKAKKSSSESSEYTIGALSSIISQGSTLPFESLFSTDKKQKDNSPPPQEKSSADVEKTLDVVDDKEAKKDEEDEELTGGSSQPNTPSLRRKVQMEDEKEFVLDTEKEKRTLFIGNLSVKTTKKDLMRLFKPFGTIESIRFRGAARPDPKTLKRVAIIKKLNHESRDTFLAYIRFKTIEEANNATKLNGKEFNGKTLRVDIAVRGDIDQKKAVFIGNLDFSSTEEEIHTHFQVCGEVSNVRLVRDKTTGMGKGFGYVNFVNSDGAQNALELHNSELRGRKIRVMRSSNRPKPVVQKRLPNKKAPGSKGNISFKKVKKSFEKNSFQGVNAAGSDDKPKKKIRTKQDRKKNLIAKKLASK